MDAVTSDSGLSVVNTRPDLLFFVGTFVVGFAAYLVLHFVVGANQLIVTGLLAALMLTYALVVLRVPRLRVRLDQAGDNAYYLGLLFTLTSMGIALYDFSGSTVDDDARIDAIVGNFGVALTSTVMGILLRVVLHQMRVDPAEVESASRIELSEAATRVRAELRGISIAFAQACSEMSQRTQDVVQEVSESASGAINKVTADLGARVEQTLEASARAHERIVTSARTSIEDLSQVSLVAKDAIEKFRAVKLPPTSLAKRLDEISSAVGSLTEKFSGLGEQLNIAAERGTRSGKSMEAAAENMTTLSRSVDTSHRAVVDALTSAVRQVTQALEQTGVALQRERSLMADLEAATRSTLENADRSQQSATKVLETLADALNKITAAIDAKVAGTP